MKIEHNIYLAGGCFWGLAALFDKLSGVKETECGYSNGHTENPTYQEVCNSETGFAETVKVTYDTTKTNLTKLLTAFFTAINPLQENGQGNDYGTQYRTGIYYTDPNDKPIIEQFYKETQKHYGKKLATEVQELENYYTAEDYHQKYLAKNPTGYCHLNIPKILTELGEK